MESFTPTKSFIHIFELCNIVHKISLPCISFPQKWKSSTKPPNSCFQLALNTFAKKFFIPNLIVASFLCERNYLCILLCRDYFLLPKGNSLVVSSFQDNFNITKDKRKLEFCGWCFRRVSKTIAFFLIF